MAEPSCTGCWLGRALRRVTRVKPRLWEWRLPRLKRGPGGADQAFSSLYWGSTTVVARFSNYAFTLKRKLVPFVVGPLDLLATWYLYLCYFCSWSCVILLQYVSHYLFFFFFLNWGRVADAVTQMVKNLPAMQETQGPSLGREDLLEKGMATHSSILAWRVPWTDEPGEIQSVGFQRVRHDWVTNTFSFIVALWCCACFYCTAKCTSYTYTCIPSFLDLLPI